MSKYPLRLQGDKEADVAFTWLKENPSVYKNFSSIKTNDQLEAFTKAHVQFSFFDCTMIDEEEHLPALSFFETYTQQILTALGLYSLPYCYAGANGARVLVQSKKIVDEPQVRLMETAQFVFDICTRGAYKPQGKGYVSIAKVRLMHAAVRHYAARSITDETPVNQEDMLGTFLSFSLLVIRGVRKLGVVVSEREADNYYQLWSKIGQLMGIRKEHIPLSIKGASLLDRQIKKREFRYSDEGNLLTKSLIKYLQTNKDQLGGIDPADIMYLLLGDEVAGYLGMRPVTKVKLDTLEVALRTQNFFKSFSDGEFEQLLKEFQRNMKSENVKPEFGISFE